jgi:dTDP-4-dehydrorhamnose reductase
MARVEDVRPVVVLGAGGMLATDLAKTLEDVHQHCIALSENDLDITFQKRISAVLEEVQPRIVINAAAYTNVDGAESEREKAFAVNGEAPGYLADSCLRVGARLIHISTDYVFDGANPINAYGASKLMGERRISNNMDNYLIIRTSWLYGPGGGNFVTTMLNMGKKGKQIRVVDDQRGAPTYTRHLAQGILNLSETDVCGTLHLTNSGNCSWFELAKEIFKKRGLEVETVPISTEEYPLPAARPKYSVLDCKKAYELIGSPLPDWREAVAEFLKLSEI